MSWFVTNFIAAFLLPPLNLLLLLALGIILLYRRSKFAKPLIISAFCLLWIISMPYFAQNALHLLDGRTAVLDSRHKDAEAIVILGGGTYFHAPEYGGADTVGGTTLVRLRYGAKLQRETGKPILVTGGKPLGNSTSEAQQMRHTLEQEFKIPVRWIEDASDNTFENARYSFQTLQKEGIKKIYLVTDAYHMPRSAETFRRVGFEVVEAPTAFNTDYKTDLLSFLPSADALGGSKTFVHEIIGLLWYRLKFALSGK